MSGFITKSLKMRPHTIRGLSPIINWDEVQLYCSFTISKYDCTLILEENSWLFPVFSKMKVYLCVLFQGLPATVYPDCAMKYVKSHCKAQKFPINA